MVIYKAQYNNAQSCFLFTPVGRLLENFARANKFFGYICFSFSGFSIYSLRICRCYGSVLTLCNTCRPVKSQICTAYMKGLVMSLFGLPKVGPTWQHCEPVGCFLVDYKDMPTDQTVVFPRLYNHHLFLANSGNHYLISIHECKLDFLHLFKRHRSLQDGNF